jgi:hypothetical protein
MYVCMYVCIMYDFPAMGRRSSSYKVIVLHKLDMYTGFCLKKNSPNGIELFVFFGIRNTSRCESSDCDAN